MENLFLLKVQVYLFFLSLAYVFYYVWRKIYFQYFKIKNMIKPKLENIEKRIKTKISIDNTQENYKITWWKQELKYREKIELIELLKRIRLNLTKGYLDTAKALIVEWLALDKFNKELNLELAWIYEKEKKFKNAELIYKDLIEASKGDLQVLKKLGFNLAMQRKFIDSIQVYIKVHEKMTSDDEVIDIISNLTYEIWDYKTSLEYAKLFLKDKPRSVEKLILKWTCLEKLWKIEEALEAYEKALELQPYNNQIANKIKNLKS